MNQRGFTLVELMVVVLIIGILVSIAVPVYFASLNETRGRACMANQRNINGAIDLYFSMMGHSTTHQAGELSAGQSDWYDTLVPDWITNGPSCPANGDAYYLDASGEVLGDSGGTIAFKPGHSRP